MSIDLGDGGDEPPEEISRDRAKELIDDVEAGTLIVVDTEPVPVLGELPDDEIPADVLITSYQFGSIDEFTFGDGGDGA